MMQSTLTIVLAEDDDGHAVLVERNLRRAGVTNPIVRAVDGVAAVEKINEFVASGVSALLLLDIKMPRLDGVGVLKELKSKPATASIPVVVLTTTDDPREIDRCYELGCNIYVTKPVQYDSFIEAVKRLGLFLQVVQLPRG